MSDKDIKYTRQEGEDDLALLLRVGKDKDKIGTWDDVAAIMNELTGASKGESAWRKKFKLISTVVTQEGKLVEERTTELTTTDDDIVLKMRELERSKIKYRDERREWQKQNYSDARIEETLDVLEEAFKDIRKVQFTPVIKASSNLNHDKELIICLSDLHIGQYFDNLFGSYSSDIAKERLRQYLEKIHQVVEMHHPWKAHIVLLGDNISGNIHKTIAISNKEDVISQIKTATELVASFCAECSSLFDTVLFYSVSGNHSRIDKKDDAVHNERLDDIISWAVGLCLKDQDNFHVMDHRKLDTGIVDIDCCGKTYIGCHGDYDPMTKSGVSNLSMMLGFIPYGIVRGHMHSPAMNEINGVKVIQSGSLAGSGDDHTVEMRLTGKPSQAILVCDKTGIDAIYNVELK